MVSAGLHNDRNVKMLDGKAGPPRSSRSSDCSGANGTVTKNATREDQRLGAPAMICV